MDVKMATPLLAALRPAQGLSATGGTQFTKVLDQALQSVSGAQNDAARLQREFTLGNESVSLEDTVMAMQKAQIAFQAALTVRNRLVSAYTDIMNMSV